jgi:hypothetical protein
MVSYAECRIRVFIVMLSAMCFLLDVVMQSVFPGTHVRQIVKQFEKLN